MAPLYKEHSLYIGSQVEEPNIQYHDGFVEATIPRSLKHSLMVEERFVEDSGFVTGYQTNFDRLVDDIKAILGPSSGIDSEDIDVSSLMKTMEQYVSEEGDWAKYALAEPSRSYTRNGVDDINKKANLLILVWNPSKGSMIHDHANAHCIMKILKGKLTETLYEWPEVDSDSSEDAQPLAHHSLAIKRERTLATDQVAYMSDKLGLHRIFNHGTEAAVSLHLYTPPWAAKCKYNPL